MNAKDIFYKTLIISVIVQMITFLFETFSLFVKVPSEFAIIRELLILGRLRCFLSLKFLVMKLRMRIFYGIDMMTVANQGCSFLSDYLFIL
jgi:hypothetical protein